MRPVGSCHRSGNYSTAQDCARLGLHDGGTNCLRQQPQPGVNLLYVILPILTVNPILIQSLGIAGGELYSWGSNIYGQLGVKPSSELDQCNYPMRLTTLLGIPVAAIACGGNHSFLISKSSAVFGWGRNNCGQLGLNDETNRAYPTQLKTLRTLGVRFVACGDEYSVFLTNEGGVFTCGAGAYGQLGHGFNSNEMLPRMVMELMGSTISQVACGNRHTLALVPSRGRIYGFGLGSSGQLGTRSTNNLNLPQVVVGPWVSPSGTTLLQSNNAQVSVVIHQIFSGGDQSIVTTSRFQDKSPPADCRIYE